MSIICFVLVQGVVFLEGSMLPIILDGIKRNPQSFLVIMITCSVLPVCLIGVLLAFLKHGSVKPRNEMIMGIGSIAINSLFLFLHFKGYLSFASSTISHPLLLIGFGIGVLLCGWKDKCNRATSTPNASEP